MAKNQTRSVELWGLEKLKPYSNNPRTHTEAQVAQIAASIEEYGFTNPILVDTKAGILAGHGRLRAAQKLGLAKVPVLVLDHLTDPQKRAYILADNKLAENAGWDEELLAAELEALKLEEYDLALDRLQREGAGRTAGSRRRSSLQSRRLTGPMSCSRNGRRSAASSG